MTDYRKGTKVKVIGCLLLMPQVKFRVLLYFILSIFLTVSSGLTDKAFSQEPEKQKPVTDKLFIYKLKPENKNGKGYKLVYFVDVSLEVFWRFKTDFGNDFLLSNKYIKSHRLINRQKNVFITEDEYSYKPGTTFRWQTTVISDGFRLIFKLLNPEECNQRYHYGYIQLEAFETKTKVTQIAYFDFFGVSFWANYPFYGGMYDFLENTAHWEQETILKLKDRYINKSDE
jgi:hypothetical protein